MNFSFEVANFDYAMVNQDEEWDKCCANQNKCSTQITRDILYTKSQDIISMFIFLLYLLIALAVLFNFYSIWKFRPNKTPLKKIIIINTIVLISASSNFYLYYSFYSCIFLR